MTTVDECVAPATTPERHRPRLRVLSVLGWVAALVLVAQWPLRVWVAEPLVVRTSSMSPTLEPGERVLTWKAGAGDATWHRGEVVSLRHDGQVWLKRVVALGGDSVALRDGRLVVNGHVVHEPWSDPDRVDSVYFGPVRVPDGAVFVMGDNRGNSEDSRTFGAVPESEITGRVVAVVWPHVDAVEGASR